MIPITQGDTDVTRSHIRRIVPLFSAAAFMLAPGVPALAAISGTAAGEAFESGNLVEQDSEQLPNQPHAATGIVSASSINSLALSKSTSELGAGALGASAATSASGRLVTTPGGDIIIGYGAHAIGTVTYTDTLTITSPTLPNGTLVDINFCWAVDLVLTSAHTSPNATNATSASGNLTFRVTPQFQGAGINRFDSGLKSNNNLPVLNGVWASGMENQTINAFVGATMTILVALSTSSDTTAANRTGLIEEASGGAQFCAAVVFGATSLQENVVVRSSYLGNAEFPSSTECTPAYASQFVPVLPAPASGSVVLLAASLAMIPRRRIRSIP